MNRNDMPAPFTKNINSRYAYVNSLKVDPESHNDKEFGTQWVFCNRHKAIHTTGWCSHLNVYKQPLYAKHYGEAEREYNQLTKEWKRLTNGN